MQSVLGLSTWRWSNNLKSLLLLAAFPFLLLMLLWGIAFLWGWVNVLPDGRLDPNFLAALHLPPLTRPLDVAATVVIDYWPIVLGVATIWVLIGYFFNDALIHAATGAKPVTRSEAPKLYNLLENLCISRGLPMPRLCLIDGDEMNAYASGIDAGSFSITVTRGLLDKLDDAEVEAVLAHELTHIINRDVRLLIITIVFTGMLSFLAQMLWRSLRFGAYGRSRERNKGNGAFVMMLIAALMMVVGYLLASLLRLALSRRREYLADAGSVELTKNPEALISALEKITGHSDVPHVPPEVQQLFIDNPPSLFGLFDTHPPIEDRIRILRAIGGLPSEGASIIPKTHAE